MQDQKLPYIQLSLSCGKELIIKDQTEEEIEDFVNYICQHDINLSRFIQIGSHFVSTGAISFFVVIGWKEISDDKMIYQKD